MSVRSIIVSIGNAQSRSAKRTYFKMLRKALRSKCELDMPLHAACLLPMKSNNTSSRGGQGIVNDSDFKLVVDLLHRAKVDFTTFDKHNRPAEKLLFGLNLHALEDLRLTQDALAERIVYIRLKRMQS